MGRGDFYRRTVFVIIVLFYYIIYVTNKYNNIRLDRYDMDVELIKP